MTGMSPNLAFWPDLSWPTLAWFAAIIILALTVRPKPLVSLRNLDGLLLAGMCLLVALRPATGLSCDGRHTWQWWSYLGLSIAAGYWLLRGIGLMLARRVPGPEGRLSSGALFVLCLAGLALCVHQIAAAPLSADSRDGIVGGIYTAGTGKLPYGDAPGFDSRSPLLYLLHAGTVRIHQPSYITEDGSLRTLRWDNREQWLSEPWLEMADLSAARLVNAALFVALLAGMYVIGLRLHSAAVGLTMGAVLCVFPGTLECLPQPEIMLPAVLMTWSIAFALLPAGGLLGTFCLVLAGAAWPWAWLGLPVMLAYFLRRGWHVLASLVGLAAGVALLLVGTTRLTEPTLPRAKGASAAAGAQPAYVAKLGDGEQLLLERYRPNPDERSAAVATAPLWRFLLARDATLNRSFSDAAAKAARLTLPDGVSLDEVRYAQLDASGAARTRLESLYQRGMSNSSDPQFFWAGLRTVLEATWLPAEAPPPTTVGAWNLWGGPPPMEGRWLLARRLVKLGVALLVVWVALAILFGGRARPRHLIGAFVVVGSGTLLASASGAVTNLVWLLPLVLALGAVHEPPPTRPAALEPALEPFASGGPAPRITLQS